MRERGLVYDLRHTFSTPYTRPCTRGPSHPVPLPPYFVAVSKGHESSGARYSYRYGRKGQFYCTELPRFNSRPPSVCLDILKLNMDTPSRKCLSAIYSHICEDNFTIMFVAWFLNFTKNRLFYYSFDSGFRQISCPSSLRRYLCTEASSRTDII